MVQFVVDIHNRYEYAVKFFLDLDAFLSEATLYAACFPTVHCTTCPAIAIRAHDTLDYLSGVLGEVETVQAAARFLPRVEAVHDTTARELEDPCGHPLPPCIVMEKGESLHDWSDRTEMDTFTALAVRLAGAAELCTMAILRLCAGLFLHAVASPFHSFVTVVHLPNAAGLHRHACDLCSVQIQPAVAPAAAGVIYLLCKAALNVLRESPLATATLI